MDRNILFRGKQLDNGEWVKGYLVKHPSAIQIGYHSPWYISVPPVDPDDSAGIYNVALSTVGQYTGLDDKHGNRIFEGDIVKEVYRRLNGDIECSIYEVKWDNYSCGFHLIYEDEHSERSACLVPHGCYEVIGNHWDNPELLNSGTVDNDLHSPEVAPSGK